MADTAAQSYDERVQAVMDVCEVTYAVAQQALLMCTGRVDDAIMLVLSDTLNAMEVSGPGALPQAAPRDRVPPPQPVGVAAPVMAAPVPHPTQTRAMPPPVQDMRTFPFHPIPSRPVVAPSNVMPAARPSRGVCEATGIPDAHNRDEAYRWIGLLGGSREQGTYFSQLAEEVSPDLKILRIGRAAFTISNVQLISELMDVCTQKDDILLGTMSGADGLVPKCDAVNDVIARMPWNDMHTSDQRRDKFLMQECLKAAGLPYARSQLCETPEAVTEWMEAQALSYPIVLKPPQGAGTEGVQICEGPDDVCAHVFHWVGRTSVERTITRAVVAQEYLVGTEYVVDTVTINGKHYVTDVWKSYKGWGVLYDRQEFVPRCADAADVIDYTLKALDAVGLRQGCGHTELMLTRDGPRLIEINARPQGDVPRASRFVGYDQFVLTAFAIAQPERLEGIPQLYDATVHGTPLLRASPVALRDVPQEDRHDYAMWVVFLKSNVNGIVDTAGVQRIEDLPTFVKFTRSIMKVPNARIQRTTDLLSSPGAVLLAGRQAQIEMDYAAVRAVEETGLFIDVPQPTLRLPPELLAPPTPPSLPHDPPPPTS